MRIDDQLDALTAEAESRYRAIVLRIAQGQTVASEELRTALADAGRSTADLRRHADLVENRLFYARRLKARVDPRVEADHQRLAEVRQQLTAMRDEYRQRVGSLEAECQRLEARCFTTRLDGLDGAAEARRMLTHDLLPPGHADAVRRAVEAGDRDEVARLDQLRFAPDYIDWT